MPRINKNESSEENYSQEQFESDLQELESLINQSQLSEESEYSEQSGGKKTHTSKLRHFKLATVDGKEVDFEATANVKDHQTPLSAAKKLLRSYCRALKLKETNRLKVDIKFTIRESTRGSGNKIFGPYTGKYRKYTPAEMKKAQASGITFHMKPEVKLLKSKKQKGGAKM